MFVLESSSASSLVCNSAFRSWKKPLLIATILGQIPIVHCEICPGPSMTVGFHELVLSSSSGDSCYTGPCNAGGLISWPLLPFRRLRKNQMFFLKTCHVQHFLPIAICSSSKIDQSFSSLHGYIQVKLRRNLFYWEFCVSCCQMILGHAT